MVHSSQLDFSLVSVGQLSLADPGSEAGLGYEFSPNLMHIQHSSFWDTALLCSGVHGVDTSELCFFTVAFQAACLSCGNCTLLSSSGKHPAHPMQP